MSLKISVGKVLREIRVSKGMSLGDLSEATKLPKGNLSRLETKGAGLTLNSLEIVCNALEVKPSSVFRKAEKDNGNV